MGLFLVDVVVVVFAPAATFAAGVLLLATGFFPPAAGFAGVLAAAGFLPPAAGFDGVLVAVAGFVVVLLPEAGFAGFVFCAELDAC